MFYNQTTACFTESAALSNTVSGARIFTVLNTNSVLARCRYSLIAESVMLEIPPLRGQYVY